ncbi:DinB family protein [Deinococcus sp. KNUC1210]|uniref:DinB family protein n=1 Tax=Deinococcus sp. KNUC1210 TaxID=2917691 RepID=UPI001EEFCBA4|nr:DinB family protein [Deinococcus sp. KNUC1210]ULH14573.1 DinB family protein [Deinococcus sp. KNUC1210]
MTTLREVLLDALPRLEALSEEQAAHQTAPDVWSAKQVLGHLTDSACNNHVRFVRASLEDGLSLPGYAQNDWVRVGGYQERRWAEVLTLWQAYQLQLAHVIEQLPPSSLNHTLSIGGGDPVTLAFVAADYVRHQLHHLAQIWERTGA